MAPRLAAMGMAAVVAEIEKLYVGQVLCPQRRSRRALVGFEVQVRGAAGLPGSRRSRRGAVLPRSLVCSWASSNFA